VFSQCEFGSDAFKKLVYKPEYRVQVLHHALVANLTYVLFVVAGITRIHYAVLIRFPESKLGVMKVLLTQVYNRSLKWAYFPSTGVSYNEIPEFREEIVSSKSYPITKESVLFSWIIWKRMLSMIQKTLLPLPRAHKIIPEIVARWNRSKGRVDEMTRYLDAMTFPFSKGTPKQLLVMREFKKMAVNVCFILKHCFPKTPAPIGKGYTAIQSHYKHLKMTMKDVLFQLASGYRIMNPIRGLLPNSPLKGMSGVGTNADDIDMHLEEENSEWQRKASAYVKERITENSRYKLKKFRDDATLNKIRMDRTLFHIPKSLGSYIDTRTGRPTSSGKRAKEKNISSQENMEESGQSSQHTVRKIRKCPPKCVVCCALADPKDKDSKITQTTIFCSTCLVSLCIKKKANRRSSCFEIFHQVGDLSYLKSRQERMSGDSGGRSSSSRKRKATDNEEE
jgi:hypothetical protein